MQMLVTAGVKCFNNARYIREALESAFDQTYRPLEIVVSDDGSTDGSAQIIEEVIRERGSVEGVEVVFNRNAANLGNLGNWEKICELAKGEFIVKFDGDDVSEPGRVAAIAAAVGDARAEGREPTVVGHGGRMMTPSGRPMGAMHPASAINHTGAAMAFSRRCYTDFPKSVCDPRGCDDELYAWRARMIGDFVEMEDQLIGYRIGTGASTALLSVRRPMLRTTVDLVGALSQCALDVAALPAQERDEWSARIAAMRAKAEARLELLTGSSIARRRAAARSIDEPCRAWGFFKFAFVLPRPLGGPLLFGYALLRHIARRIRG